MSWEDLNRELSYQRIAELHADAERFRQVRVSRRRARRRLGRLRRQLWPAGVASRANDILGAMLSPPSRRDTLGPTRPYSPSLSR